MLTRDRDETAPRPGATRGIASAAALRFIVLLGLVSLFADMTYEGARSISGPFLAMLGATGTVVGIVAGLGELVGYGLRLVSGFISDRTGRYWAMTLVGYAVNLAAVPLLALAGRWEIAALLMVAERMGKAIRTPARDVMLSQAAQGVGRGWGFGLHEALDQVGAVLGPLVVAGALARGAGFGTAFAILVVPALLAYAILLAARRLYPRPRDLETATTEQSAAGFHRGFWVYLAAVALIAAGYADFPLIAFHLVKRAIVPATLIPVFYAVAMGVDALGALLFGRLFDRFGLSVLVAATLLSSLFAPLAFLGGAWTAFVGVVLWSLGVGAQESVMRAAVANIMPAGRRGSAYGIFNAGFGVSWFLGSATMGVLYDTSVRALVAFSVASQLAAVPLLIIAGRILVGSGMARRERP